MGTLRRSQQGAVDAAGVAVEQSLSGDGSKLEPVKGYIFLGFLILSIVLGIAMLLTLVIDSIIQGAPFLRWNPLVTGVPSSIPSEAGLWVAIVGTFWVIGLMIITVVPLAVGAAIYLEEYADTDRWYNRVIELNIQNLAAVPSIVFGILGLGLIVRGGLSLGPVVYAGSLTLALLVLPTVILASREALRAVPPSHRLGAMALGSTKWQAIWRNVLPAAIPGIATGSILATARAIGETAPLLLIGATVFITFTPEGPLSEGYTTLPVQIFSWATRPQEEFRTLSAASIVVLLAVLLIINAFAIWIRNHYTKKQQQ